MVATYEVTADGKEDDVDEEEENLHTAILC
jgi:hypothetical protein